MELFNIIIMQVSDTHIDTRTVVSDFKKYTPYKDLEPFHEYKITDIIQLHADILRVINGLYSVFTTKEQNIHRYSDTTHVGISITSFLQTLEYENTLLREQISLYVNYVSFFHASQNMYVTKLYERIEAFQRDIEEDILSRRHHLGGGGGGGGSGSGGSNASDVTLQEVTIDRPELDPFFQLQEEPTEIEMLLRETEEMLNEGDIGLDVIDIHTEEVACVVAANVYDALDGSGVPMISSLEETKSNRNTVSKIEEEEDGSKNEDTGAVDQNIVVSLSEETTNENG